MPAQTNRLENEARNNGDYILWRILHNGGMNRKGIPCAPTPGFIDGDLRPRNVNIIPNDKSVESHFVWEKFDGPWMSVCTFAKLRRLIYDFQGMKDITVVAFHCSAFDNRIYDAYNYARRLGYTDHSMDRRRQLRYHHGEYIVHQGYFADDYKILAVFPLRDVGALAPNGWKAELSDQVYMHTGVRNEQLVDQLMFNMGLRKQIDVLRVR